MTDDKYAPVQSETADVAPVEPQSNEPTWYIDENTPGQGARPEWMPSNYKRLSDIAKSQQALEKKLGSFTGAPDNYDLSSLEIDADGHLVKEMSSVAKEMNMSQEGFNKFIGRLHTAAETENNAHLETEVEKMGKDGPRMLTEFKNWTKDYLKPEEREVATEWVKSAEDLKLFNRIMANTHMSSVPTAQSMNMANSFESVKELRAEMTKNIERYKTDKNYRTDFSSRLSRAVTREGG